SSTLWDQRKGRFYDPWEEAPESERQRYRRAQLEETVSWAARLDFYRERLRGVELRSPHPLAHVPVLTADQFRAELPPQGTGAVAGSGYTVFQSGGTTGL